MENLKILDEEYFEEEMEEYVAPWLQESVRDGFLTSFDGTQIHYYYAHHPNAKGSVVFSHGFCEFFGKYHEMTYYFYQMGYSIYFMDHRGHGYSERKVEGWSKVYVKDYSEYVGDLKCFLDKFVLPEMNYACEKRDHLYLFAHSMGGAIATLFLEKYPQYFKAAILSSPLMRLNMGKYKDWQVRAILGATKLLPMDLKYVPGQHGFDGVNVFPTSSAMSRPRYEYMFEMRKSNQHFQSYGGCFAWTRASVKACDELLKNAGQIKIPVLLLEAGHDSMVKPEGHKAFLKKAKHAKFVLFENSKHEIFNAQNDVVPDYYETIFNFLEQA